MNLELLFELSINLIENFIIIGFVTSFLGAKYSDGKKYLGFIFAWLISFLQMSISNYFVIFDGVGILIPVAINFIYSIVFLRGSIWFKLFVSAMIEAIMIIVGVGTNLLVCTIIGYDPVMVMSVFSPIRIAIVVAAQILLLCVTIIILKFKYNNKLSSKELVLLMLVPIVSIISLSFLMYAIINKIASSEYIFIGMIGIVFINIISYYLFVVLNKEYEDKARLYIINKQYKNEKQTTKQIQALFEQLGSLRHDIDKRLSYVLIMLENGNSDKAIEYINETINKLPLVQNVIKTENEFFNAVVNSKIVECNEKNIYINIAVMKNALEFISAEDIYVLFGNLLDNAIEAAEKSVGKKIFVDVRKQKSYISIVIKNSISESVLTNNPELKTTKTNSEGIHGFGTKSVDMIVKKYSGMIDYYENEGKEFCCDILLSI